MSYKIVTNNPKVESQHKDVIFVNGSFEDVLLRVRDLVHSGHELINHPLGASIRMFYSPYRSIVIGEKIIGEKEKKINNIYAETIENSIENYRKHMEVRTPDTENKEDYALIDSQLLISALGEHERNLKAVGN